MAWRQGKVGGIGAKESNKMRIIVNSPCTATTRVCVECVVCVAPQPVCQFALSLVVATCNELASERACAMWRPSPQALIGASVVK